MTLSGFYTSMKKIQFKKQTFCVYLLICIYFSDIRTGETLWHVLLPRKKLNGNNRTLFWISSDLFRLLVSFLLICFNVFFLSSIFFWYDLLFLYFLSFALLFIVNWMYFIWFAVENIFIFLWSNTEKIDSIFTIFPRKYRTLVITPVSI